MSSSGFVVVAAVGFVVGRFVVDVAGGCCGSGDCVVVVVIMTIESWSKNKSFMGTFGMQLGEHTFSLQ